MSNRPLHLLFTMDCEALAEHSRSGGPPTWELAERAVRGFCDALIPARVHASCKDRLPPQQ